MSTKTYPVGGFAPGLYWCTCRICGVRFDGAKRSYHCEPCGTKAQEEWDWRHAAWMNAMTAEYGPYVEPVTVRASGWPS